MTSNGIKQPNRISKSDHKVSKSCDHCKLKKIKCDQKTPQCDNCVKYAEPCVYSVMKKPGLKSGYGQQVFDRIDKLDKYIEESKTQYNIENRKLSDQLKALEEKFNSLQGKGLTPLSSSSNLPPSRSPMDSMVDNNRLTIEAISNPLEVDEFPEMFKIERLIDIYFEYINPLFPILHPSLDRQAVCENLGPDNTLLLGVLVSSLTLGNHLFALDGSSYYDSLKGKIISKCFAVKTVDELKSMALLAFTLYSRGEYQESWSAISLAVGGCLHLGIIKEVNDGSDSLQDWETWSKRETTRNLIWEIYKLDRLSSMGSHFSSKLPEEEMTCYLPLNPEFWKIRAFFDKHFIEKSQTRTLFNMEEQALKQEYNDVHSTNSFIIEVVNLMSICSAFRQHPMDVKDMKSVLSWQLNCYEFEKRVQNWRNALPKAVATFLEHGTFMGMQLNVELVILFSLYHVMLIRLHSPTAFSNFPDNLISSQESKPKCLTSAHLILKVSEQLPETFQLDESSTYQMFGPYYTFSVWVSGRVILVNAIRCQEELDSAFNYSINLLRILGPKWECANKYADILDFFKNDYLTGDMSSNDGTADHSFHSSTHEQDTKLISDIKLNASTLDSLLSKRVNRYTRHKGLTNDLSIFEWFKLPINETFLSR